MRRGQVAGGEMETRTLRDLRKLHRIRMSVSINKVLLECCQARARRLWPLRGYGGRHEWSPHRLKPKIFAFRPPAEKACQVFSRTAPISNDPQQHCHKSCKGFGVLTSQPCGFDNIFNHRPVPRTAPDTRDITAGRAGATPPSRSFRRTAGTARCPGAQVATAQPCNLGREYTGYAGGTEQAP